MEQRSPEWFAARAGRLTASTVGAALDLAPYMSRDDAFRALVRSINDMPSEFEGNIATDYGTNNEDGARYEYELETGNTVAEAGFVPWDTWLGASPDGYIGEDGLIEIKCPFGLRNEEKPKFKSIKDQPHYHAQIQVQLFCTGRQWCDFYQWAPKGTSLERVKYDPAWISEHMPILRDFFCAAQEADPKDYEGPKRPVIDTPEMLKLVAEYDDLTEAIERAGERKKEVLALIVLMADGRDSVCAGRNLTKTVRKGGVSYAKALKAYAPDADLEPFRGKPSEYWGLK